MRSSQPQREHADHGRCPAAATAPSSLSGAHSGCGCVPDLTPPADRVTELRMVLATEPEPMVSLTHLLRLCRTEHPTLWEHHADPRCRARIDRLMADVASALPAPGTAASVTRAVGEALAAAITTDPDVPAVVVAHALAELLDTHYGHSFTDWFRARSPYQPAVGDPIPLDSPDLREVTDLAPTAPPWRLANRLDETRRVRLAGAWTTQFRVVFDYSAFDALDGVVGADTVIATCHPNHDLGELGFIPGRDGPAFPVQPADLQAQRQRLDRLLTEASAAGAGVVVLPELSVTADLAADLESWVRRPGPVRLLVAGSFHHADPTDPTKRANRALAWVRGHAQPLSQDKHSPADRPVTEDITPPGWPEIRVHVTADGWHVVIAVCRDLLNPQAVHALTEAGANLVLAPSMTETLVPFGGPVAQLVGTGQALVAVANNPCDWSTQDRSDSAPQPARALFGHPGFVQQTRQVHAADDRPGIALLRVRSGRLGWRPATPEPRDHPTPAADGPERTTPAWAELLRLHATTPTPGVAAITTLRAAAVLVVVIGSQLGPKVLLTGRAPDLTHYADQFVFPGGAADPADCGPTDTALREAREETGLDPTSVHIVGALPAFGLPDSGFLVTPVLAWSPEPLFSHPANPAEVATMHMMELAAWRAQRRTVDDPDPMAVGVMTSTILDLLAGLLADATDATIATPPSVAGGNPASVAS